MNGDLLAELTSLTPIDGRYRKQTNELSEYLSEFALIKTRVEIEIKYLIYLSEFSVLRKLNKKELLLLKNLYEGFTIRDAIKIKKLEKITRHDIKAVEKFIVLSLKNTSLENLSEFVHIFLTSEDINNLAYRLMLNNALTNVLFIKLLEIKNNLSKLAKKYKNIKMLARTHGQPAVPTTFGKEIYVFYKRFEKDLLLLKTINLTGKINGAVGNYNSFYFVSPKINWIKFSKQFVLSFNLKPNLITTQINSFEDIISIFQTFQRINGILLDANQDLWRYISDDWLKLAIKNSEVGSSTMPQKVNPIDFENSEGNLTLANGLMQTMIDKLYVSRLQRDLSCSTIIRNIGTAMGFCLIGYRSFTTGLTRIDVNKPAMFNDLGKDWGILSEALQTYLRNKGFKDSYFFVSSFTKGRRLNEKTWKELINSLKIPELDKQNLLQLTPQNYTGLVKQLVK